MKIEGTVYCEAPECDTHQHVGVPNMNAGRLPVGWLRVVSYLDDGPSDQGFCSIDCVMKWAAKFPPPEIIPWDDALGGGSD